jgi:hypothetical protein
VAGGSLKYAEGETVVLSSSRRHGRKDGIIQMMMIRSLSSDRVIAGHISVRNITSAGIWIKPVISAAVVRAVSWSYVSSLITSRRLDIDSLIRQSCITRLKREIAPTNTKCARESPYVERIASLPFGRIGIKWIGVDGLHMFSVSCVKLNIALDPCANL